MTDTLDDKKGIPALKESPSVREEKVCLRQDC